MDRQKVEVNISNGELYFVFSCPHCLGTIIVHNNETRCCIFRHGVFKNNFQQMNPHTSKDDCERFVTNGEIEGCGKPFRFVFSYPDNYVEKCDYI